jgi:hypothetical protein
MTHINWGADAKINAQLTHFLLFSDIFHYCHRADLGSVYIAFGIKRNAFCTAGARIILILIRFRVRDKLSDETVFSAANSNASLPACVTSLIRF